MSTNHNRIKVADLEKNEPNKTLITNENGELEFIDANLKANVDSPIFTGTPEVPAPTTENGIVNKSYADGLIAGLLNDRGSYNASTNLFPATGGSGTSGSIKKGDLWYVSIPGTLGTKAVNIGDSFRALVNTPGQNAANWSILEANIGYVPANDSEVIHKSGNENFTGIKTTTNYGSSTNSGIRLNSAGSGNTSPLDVVVQAATTARGMNVTNLGASGSRGIQVDNNSEGLGISIANNPASTGIALSLVSQTGSTSDLLVTNKSGTTTTRIDHNGILFTPPPILTTDPVISSGTHDFITRNKTTGQIEKVQSSTIAIDANVLHKTGSEGFTGVKGAVNTGISIANGIYLTNNGTTINGTPFCIDNTSSGTGIMLGNSGSSTGVGFILNSHTASTGDLMHFKKNNILSTKIDHRGVITTNPSLTATADNQLLSALSISPTFSSAGFTGTIGVAISTNGSIIPSTTNIHHLGLATNYFSNAFIQQGNITRVSSNITSANSLRPGSTSGLEITNSTGTVLKAKMFDNGHFVIQDGNAFIDAGYFLDVKGTIRGSSTLNLGSINNAGNILLARGNDGTQISSYGFYSAAESNEVRALHGGISGFFTWYTNASNTVTEKMRLSNNGNLLIGSTSDTGAYKIDVNGASRLNGSITISDPATSLGAYDILTKNSGGIIEKIPSSILPASGSYTPSVYGSVNSTSPNTQVSKWTKIGNTYSVRINFGVAGVTTSGTVSTVTVNLPFNRTNSGALAVGSGTIGNGGDRIYPVMAISHSVSTVTFYFTQSVSEIAGGAVVLTYDISE